jgi:ssDNA-specific exonuclease RecJ
MKRTLTLLLAGTITASNAKPFESFYEPPEDVVVKAIYARERCNESFPGLKEAMDASFGHFEEMNKAYFDAVRNAPDFAEIYKVLKKHFAELEITKVACQKTIEVLSSPNSKIEAPSSR